MLPLFSTTPEALISFFSFLELDFCSSHKKFVFVLFKISSFLLVSLRIQLLALLIIFNVFTSFFLAAIRFFAAVGLWASVFSSADWTWAVALYTSFPFFSSLSATLLPPSFAFLTATATACKVSFETPGDSREIYGFMFRVASELLRDFQQWSFHLLLELFFSKTYSLCLEVNS